MLCGILKMYEKMYIAVEISPKMHKWLCVGSQMQYWKSTFTKKKGPLQIWLHFFFFNLFCTITFTTWQSRPFSEEETGI